MTAPTAASEAPEAAAPSALRETDPIAVVGVLLAVASVVFKAFILRSAYFVEDDFLFFGRAYAAELTWDYLLDLHKGHLMPGAMLLVFIHTAFTPYNWVATSAVMLAFQGAAGVALLRLLWVVFGRRWIILLPLVVYLFAPLTVPVLTWWSAALNAVPFQLAIALSVLWTVQYLRTDEHRFAWLAAGAVAFGMAFSVKAMFLPVLLFAIAVAFFHQGWLPRAALAALDAHLRFWLGLGALMAAHYTLYLARQSGAGDDGAGMPDLDVSAAMARAMLGETFPAGVVGGPIEWAPVTPAGGLAGPPTAVVVAAWAVLALLVLATLWYRRRAWRAWAILAGYLVFVDLIPTLLARGRYEALVGYDPRYVADAALLFALCLAFALLATTEERDSGGAYRRPPPRGKPAVALAAVAAIGFSGMAGYSMLTYTETLSGDRVRWYLDTVRASAAEVPEGAAIYPYPVPEDVVLPWNGHYRLSSYVLPPIATPDTAALIAAPRASARPMAFNDAGFLVAAEPGPFTQFFGPAEDEDCVETQDGHAGWNLLAAGGQGTAVGLAYSAPAETPATVIVGEEWVDTVLPAAPDGGTWYVPVQAPGANLSLFIEDGVCLTWVTYGELEPSLEGDPWAEESDEAEPGPEADAEGGEDEDGEG